MSNTYPRWEGWPTYGDRTFPAFGQFKSASNASGNAKGRSLDRPFGIL
jgi:hypothetical protein